MEYSYSGSIRAATGLKDAFAAAAPEPLVKGFAVGRFIFWSTAEDWFAGHITDGEAVIRMSERYRQVRALWRTVRAV